MGAATSRVTSLTASKDPTLVVVTPADQSRAASRGEPAGTRDPSRAASMEPLLELPSDGSGLSKEGSANGVAATPRGDALDGDALHHDVANLESIADVGDDVEPHAQDPSRVGCVWVGVCRRHFASLSPESSQPRCFAREPSQLMTSFGPELATAWLIQQQVQARPCSGQRNRRGRQRLVKSWISQVRHKVTSLLARHMRRPHRRPNRTHRLSREA